MNVISQTERAQSYNGNPDSLYREHPYIIWFTFLICIERLAFFQLRIGPIGSCIDFMVSL
jgi:hypothetical protein